MSDLHVKKRNEGTVLHDAHHASRIYDYPSIVGSSQNQNSLSAIPSHSSQFYAEFNWNPNLPLGVKLNEESWKAFTSSVVQSVNGVNVQMTTDTYKDIKNKKRIYYTGIDYGEVTITFSDSGDGRARHIFNLYRRYYFGSGWDPSDTNIKDTIGRGYNAFGFNVQSESDYDPNLLQEINIVSLWAGPVGQAMTLVNPKITNFTHSGHNYADDSEFTSFSITFKPEEVRFLTFAKGESGAYVNLEVEEMPSYLQDLNETTQGKDYSGFYTPKTGLSDDLSLIESLQQEGGITGFIGDVLQGAQDALSFARDVRSGINDSIEGFVDSELGQGIFAAAELTGNTSAVYDAIGTVNKKTDKYLRLNNIRAAESAIGNVATITGSANSVLGSVNSDASAQSSLGIDGVVTSVGTSGSIIGGATTENVNAAIGNGVASSSDTNIFGSVTGLAGRGNNINTNKGSTSPTISETEALEQQSNIFSDAADSVSSWLGFGDD